MTSEFSHISVLFDEVMEGLKIKSGGVYLDGTTGGAGHSRGILERLDSEGSLFCLDRDQDALTAAAKNLEAANSPGRYFLCHTNYGNFPLVLNAHGIQEVDGFLLDLGVSSWQLDQGERGFSYMHDGPLDMRMDQSRGRSAQDIVQEMTVEELSKILSMYGEEKEHYRIAQGIVSARREKPIATTGQLADIILKSMSARARRQKGHPAKRSFQALRIYVNDEMGELYRFLEQAPDYLSPGGVLAIITFHSLEDRIVKQKFRAWENPCTCPRGLPCVCGQVPWGEEKPRGGIVASEAEEKNNRRAHSARLRLFTRYDNVVTVNR